MTALADVSLGGPEPLTAADVVLPGSGARLRSSGVLGPSDIPTWMTRGGGGLRAGAAAMAATSAAVRRAGEQLGIVLPEAASALGWEGAAAGAARGEAAALRDRLGVVATQLDDAHRALTAFAGELDGQHGVLGTAAVAWAGAADPAQRAALLRRWQPAVEALDAADARAAEAASRVAAALGRSQLPAGAPVGGIPAGDRAPGVGGDLLEWTARSAGRAWQGSTDGLASVADAAGQHPGAVVELLAGLWLMQAGAGGEMAGTALDLTGVGAAAGVPVNVASAGLILTGAGLMTMGAAELGGHAASGDPASSARAGDPVPIDMSRAAFAQRTAGNRFSFAGTFKGRLVDDVADDLRAGRLSPQDVPIDVVRREGKVLILNTRSSVALERAGIPRSQWRTVDRSGLPGYERRLDRQLARNRLDANGVDSVGLLGGE